MQMEPYVDQSCSQHLHTCTMTASFDQVLEDWVVDNREEGGCEIGGGSWGLSRSCSREGSKSSEGNEDEDGEEIHFGMEGMEGMEGTEVVKEAELKIDGTAL